jgi:hypothetical protein
MRFALNTRQKEMMLKICEIIRGIESGMRLVTCMILLYNTSFECIQHEQEAGSGITESAQGREW